MSIKTLQMSPAEEFVFHSGDQDKGVWNIYK